MHFETQRVVAVSLGALLVDVEAVLVAGVEVDEAARLAHLPEATTMTMTMMTRTMMPMTMTMTTGRIDLPTEALARREEEGRPEEVLEARPVAQLEVLQADEPEIRLQRQLLNIEGRMVSLH